MTESETKEVIDEIEMLKKSRKQRSGTMITKWREAIKKLEQVEDEGNEITLNGSTEECVKQAKKAHQRATTTLMMKAVDIPIPTSNNG